MPTFRGFIAIDIDAFPILLKYEKDILNSGVNVKVVEPENVHITLKFLGETKLEDVGKIEEIIKKAVENIEPFKIQLKGTGVFPNENYIKIIWIGIQNGEKIGIIVNKIDNDLSKLGYKKENRSFSPHLTIGRLKSAKNKNELLKIIENYKNTEFAEVKVDKVKLIKSELTPKGPIYTTILEIPI